MKVGGKTSMIDTFYSIMSDRDEIAEKEAIRLIQELTGYSKESVANSTFSQSHFYSMKKFNTKFGCYIKGTSKMVVKLDYAQENGINIVEDYINYKTPEKQNARELMFSDIDVINRPLIITFPNRYGYDIDYIMSRNPKARVDALEIREDISDQYRKKCEKCGYKNVSFFNLSINSYLKKYGDRKVDVLYYDCRSHIGVDAHEDLQIINKNRKYDVVGITLDHIKGIRNSGTWGNLMREKYKDVQDQQQLALIMDTLTNYKIVGRLIYQGCNTSNRRKNTMALYKFKLI